MEMVRLRVVQTEQEHIAVLLPVARLEPGDVEDESTV